MAVNHFKITRHGAKFFLWRSVNVGVTFIRSPNDREALSHRSALKLLKATADSSFKTLTVDPLAAATRVRPIHTETYISTA